MFSKKKPKVRKFEYCKLNELKEPAALSSSPGEFDLLDARSLMERGDFTGAIRRTVTAVETLVDEKVNAIIRKKEPEPQAEKAINKLRYDWDAKFQMLRDKLKIGISETLVEAFHHTQQVRNAHCSPRDPVCASRSRPCTAYDRHLSVAFQPR